MFYYRLYYFDRFSGHIDHCREFEAEDDGAALALAVRWSDGRAMELWNRDRRLKQWESVGPAAG
ncbi:MAG TPA: hypothetical protein VFK28_01565 [Sphingomicrobium sp.]|jgi:hypothetical protein|nr:hypothetical protein [Sphingomicrobium sp.]